MFRTIRAEDRSADLVTLDVEYGQGPSTHLAIEHLLRRFTVPRSKTLIDSEFVERGSILHISRVTPDVLVNNAKDNEDIGGPPVTRELREIEGIAKLQTERIGTLDSLFYSQQSIEDEPMLDFHIEVDIKAAGLNFKDVAVTMGIVPENEHLLGLEGAGVVRRVGKGSTGFSVGDRVAILKNGTFANRIQCPIERAHRIPETMSFVDAATIPLVYLTSLYSLFDIGGLKKGQSVLIHSAAGGVGLSAIQLAQWAGAEIFVTVGTQEKRDFLHEKYGIPYDRMFSSRTTAFGAEILAATENKGIDVILNSLTGELLDESWRICADGGHMVEIGKKDIVSKNFLSMEPFDRNCSYRGVDFSYSKQIKDTLIQE
jgi:NADPH:quinone reductase-like Zn-dependent oxidoreductase